MMGSTKLITTCLVLTFTLIAVLMEHSAFGSTLREGEREEISMTFLKIDEVKQNIRPGKNVDDDELQMKPVDCSEVLRSGHNQSGVYTVLPKNRIIDRSVEVYCDMDTDGGGWTVIQRRGDYGSPEDYFYRDWDSYKRGFGDITQDFWLGNDLIFSITSQRRYSIRFDLSDFEGNTVYALYDNFLIEGESGQYRLHISNYSGNASDSMTLHDLNNMKFSTKDRDNDEYAGSCAQDRMGAWWYKTCTHSNLNGPYLKGKTSSVTGIFWYTWKTSYESLSTTEMKIRPMSFQKV